MLSLSSGKSTPPKKPTMGRLKSWSAVLVPKLSSNPDKLDLASEVEQRRKGIESLYTSTEAYWSYLAKKKPVPFDTSSLPLEDTSSTASGAVSKPERKMLPVEALGLAMSSYATSFPDGSVYGASLGLLGEAHVKLGYLQSTFTKDTSHIFLARIARSKAALDSLTAALKKLDSATSRLESAQSKVQKSKKEKRELEEELRLAKAAYDDAVTDVEARSEAIQDSENDDWQCLTTYMQAHLDYMGQAQALLEQVKSMWAPAATMTRSGASTPLTRPRSLSAPKSRPAISRRSSAKDGGEVTASSSKTASRSSLSLNSERPSLSDDAKTEKEKKSFLRMPSFQGASDTVTSVTSGIGTSIGRARSSTLFSSTSGQPSPEKDREPSKWNFISRSNKKQQDGFVTMDEAEKLSFSEQQPPALPARDYIRPSVSAHDVYLGAAEESDSAEVRVSRAYLTDSDSDGEEDNGRFEPSPFSPDANGNSFLGVHSAHETIHERGESSDYLDTSAPLALHHTGLSAYSDADPFSNGASMSPQATGGQYDGDSDEEEVERQGLTGKERETEGAGWRGILSASITRDPEAKGVRGRVPPPVPSSAGFLSKSKGRLAPPPPPLPSRNS